MAAPNPFAENPFAHGRELKLVPIPEAPETHEPRKQLRTYLAAPGAAAGGSLDALLSGMGKGGHKPVERVKVVYRDAPADPDAEA